MSHACDDAVSIQVRERERERKTVAVATKKQTETDALKMSISNFLKNNPLIDLPLFVRACFIALNPFSVRPRLKLHRLN
jgi:predicted Na+-dependent transporter